MAEIFVAIVSIMRGVSIFNGLTAFIIPERIVVPVAAQTGIS